MTDSKINKSAGHRKRLKEKFAKSGFTGFHDYEVLEFLLTFIFRQGDVKPLAKELIKTFGSFSNVLDTEVNELAKINGMGENSAIALTALRNALKYYFADSILQKKQQLTKMTVLVDFINSQIADRKNEVFLVIYLNAKNEVLNFSELSEGTVSQVSAYPRKIIEQALKEKATSVILAHNHPGGISEPSDSDVQITQEINNALQFVDITLQEHIIVANKNYYSFRREGIL